MNVSQYLASLDVHSAGTKAEQDELIEELRTHLEECAYDLQLQGLSAAQSEAEAMRRLGTADDIAAAFAKARHGTPMRRSRLMSLRARGAGLATVLALALAGTAGGGMAAAALGSAHAAAAVVRHSEQATHVPGHATPATSSLPHAVQPSPALQGPGQR
jgi:hypothetical protein